MTVGRGVKALPQKVAYIPQVKEEEIAQICGEKDVVGRILHMFFDLGSWFVCRSISIIFVRAETKAQVVGGNKLFRGGKNDWVCQTIRVVIGVVVGSASR